MSGIFRNMNAAWNAACENASDESVQDNDPGEDWTLADEEIQSSPEFVSMVDWMFRVNRQRQGEVNG